ncbi:MAG: DUF1353 domain-containing protein [Bacteroidetes bacterium]|nr:DUF1353 domain-containing protein [Bacteroidota bacterium]MCH8032286.1 DUF1353 domain-containing protein [Bacteroidota bacterium]
MLELPKLRPIPIRTKNVPPIIALWRWITSIRNWEVLEDWSYVLPDDTKIYIPEGFVFDGASIPRIFWAILSPVGLLLTPGLVHDYAYQHDKLLSLDSEGNRTIYKNKAGRGYWDRLFRDVAIEVNGFKIINNIAWIALVLFGWIDWNVKRRDEVEIS